MKTYEKPIILANSELSEGVFAASGSYQPSSQPTNNNYSFSERDSWGTGANYDFTLTNTGDEHVDSLTITVPVGSGLTGVQGNGTVTNNGDGTITITFDNYGQGFDAGQSATIYVQTTGNGDFGLKANP